MSSCRVSRKEFILPRCTKACPAGIDVPRYIRAVRDGHYDEAIAVVREKIPFPTVCADACFAPCEDACAYQQVGEPIAIRALKRAAVDKGGDSWKARKKLIQPTGKKVAIVGAGPAGLTAAYYLQSLGHAATVYDDFPKPGGMLRYGIPRYRLPEERLEKDIRHILELGVTFRANTLVGKDIRLEALAKESDAVFISSGANSGARIPLEGADKKGFLWGWEFLTDVARGRAPQIGNEVVVIGGGNVALDVALTAKRLGAKSVRIVCLEAREEMLAHPWEIALAEEEGITIQNAWAPKRVLGKEKVEGLALKRCVSTLDDACNFDPVYDDEITDRISADTIIAAIGQTPVLDFVESLPGVKKNRQRLLVEEASLATAANGVFAGGDVVTGPLSIISAIAQGRKAAEAIDRYLGGRGDISETLAQPEEEVVLKDRLVVMRRQEMTHLKPWERQDNFDQVEKGLSDAQIAAEASRCLECDARNFEVVVNTASCKECGYCAEVCQMEVFGPAAAFNARGYRPMEIKSSNWCVGCFKCFFSCPDFAIDVREKPASGRS
jgi:NADPH-dependent glutamate synthase beta subunit-like oxidoreductase